MLRWLYLVTIAICGLLLQSETKADSNQAQPNVLFIIIDDLNDWIEPLGGHPQVKTPALSRLAAQGVTFRNAHCQSPLCNPSRTSLMISRRPSKTGIYGLSPWFRDLPELKQTVSMPQHFASHGYRTFTVGKVYHNSMGQHVAPGAQPEFQVWGPAGGPGIMPASKLVPPTPAGNNPWVDWGVFEHEDHQKGDWIVADWAEEKLQELAGQTEPFFMAVGFFLPHVPCHVTQKWWDMYPEETLKLPAMRINDREDCSPFSWYLHWNIPEPRLTWLQHYNQHKNLVRAYLASISFMDSQVDRVLRAVEGSSLRDNTIVVLCSDHGFHLGEKEMTSKNTLWERSTRVPFFITGPGLPVVEVEQPVELLDVFPTVADLAGLPLPRDIDGKSLKECMVSASKCALPPAITDHNPGNQSIRDARYRLIHYADGSEELYDLVVDPHEFDNLINDKNYTEIAVRLREHVETSPAPLAAKSQHRVLEKQEDGWYWEGQRIDKLNPPMSIGSLDPAALPDCNRTPGP